LCEGITENMFALEFAGSSSAFRGLGLRNSELNKEHPFPRTVQLVLDEKAQPDSYIRRTAL